jgi:hypothetical protein
MGHNSETMIYSGYDMHGFKWRVADETVGPDKYAAASMGWKLVRNGRMRRYYRISDGMLMEAYSYNTCIMTRMAPCEDFPYGRLVINETKYSVTSEKHKGIIRGEFMRHRFLWPADTGSERCDGITMHYRVCSIEWTHRANTIDAGTDLDGDDLRRDIEWGVLHAADMRAEMHEQRLQRIARIKADNAAIDAENAENVNVIHVNFRGA